MANPGHTHDPSNDSRRWWLRHGASLQLIAAASLSCVSGCAGGVDSNGQEALEADQIAADEPARAALHNDAFATPETIGGFSEEGVGVFLTAVDDVAELTVYVVAPAEIATFPQPRLHLTTQEGDHSMTEDVEFESVTLEAGESYVFSKEAEGTLLEVSANFAGEGG